MFTRYFLRQPKPHSTNDHVEQYEPLYQDEASGEEMKLARQLHKKTTWRLNIMIVLLTLVAALAGGLIGADIGYKMSNKAITEANNENKLVPDVAMDHHTSSPTTFPPPPGHHHYPLIYNITFSSAPSPKTNKVWDDLFPPMVGFVQHPVIAPNLSGLAIFHQIHCLDILRKGFYSALDGTLPEQTHEFDEDKDHNRRLDDHHLRHCFDYLRQSFMCLADTNLEPVDFELGGVTGWKFERTCRDFDAVKAWAEENRSWDEALDGKGMGGHHHHG